MRRFCTCTQTFESPIDLTEATVFVTYSQNRAVILDKTGDDLTITEDTITVMFSQEDTGKLKDGKVCAQVRYVLSDGTADASDPIEFYCKAIIKEGVIEWTAKSGSD